jgi:hypothetical protein
MVVGVLNGDPALLGHGHGKVDVGGRELAHLSCEQPHHPDGLLADRTGHGQDAAHTLRLGFLVIDRLDVLNGIGNHHGLALKNITGGQLIGGIDRFSDFGQRLFFYSFAGLEFTRKADPPPSP